MSISIRFITSLCLAAAAGCAGEVAGGDGDGDSDGDVGGGGGGGELTARQFVQAIGKTECDQAFTCKASFPTDQGTFEEAFGPSVTACYAGAADYYDATAIEAAITANTIEFDGTAAAACIDGIAAPSCGTHWTQGPSYPAACDGVMVGTIANGGACSVDFECSNQDSYCDPNSSKCATVPAGERRVPSTGLPMNLKLLLTHI